MFCLLLTKFIPCLIQCQVCSTSLGLNKLLLVSIQRMCLKKYACLFTAYRDTQHALNWCSVYVMYTNMRFPVKLISKSKDFKTYTSRQFCKYILKTKFNGTAKFTSQHCIAYHYNVTLTILYLQLLAIFL